MGGKNGPLASWNTVSHPNSPRTTSKSPTVAMGHLLLRTTNRVGGVTQKPKPPMTFENLMQWLTRIAGTVIANESGAIEIQTQGLDTTAPLRRKDVK